MAIFKTKANFKSQIAKHQCVFNISENEEIGQNSFFAKPVAKCDTVYTTLIIRIFYEILCITCENSSGFCNGC